MGPNVKFVSPICDLIFERKNRGNFFIRKKTIPGGGGGTRGGLAKDHKKYVFFGTLPYYCAVGIAYSSSWMFRR